MAKDDFKEKAEKLADWIGVAEHAVPIAASLIAEALDAEYQRGVQDGARRDTTPIKEYERIARLGQRGKLVRKA